MKEYFGLGAGVVEDQGDLVALDLFQDRGDGVFAATAGPGRGLFGDEHPNVGVGPGVGLQDIGVRSEKGRKGWGVFDCGAEADAAESRGQGGQAGELQHQLVAAFGFGKRVDFVDDDPLKAVEDPGRLFVSQ